MIILPLVLLIIIIIIKKCSKLNSSATWTDARLQTRLELLLDSPGVSLNVPKLLIFATALRSISTRPWKDIIWHTANNNQENNATNFCRGPHGAARDKPAREQTGGESSTGGQC